MLAAIWVLLPLFAFGFAESRVVSALKQVPVVFRLLLPGLFGIPYVLVAQSNGILRSDWTLCYCFVPVLIAVLLHHAKQRDPENKGDWRDYAILLLIGLAVDLRWLEPAWPSHLSVFGKMILLDTGIYGFSVIRQIEGVGFDLRLRKQDLLIGLRELAFYAPVALPLGFLLGFLHARPQIPRPGSVAFAWIFTFFLIAIPEEIFFRGWIQNLLERRIGRTAALVVTALLFGLAHFNKRSTHFNWQYVLLASLAGIFYGRAWRQNRRIAASSITHATVDTIWSIWL